MERAKGFEPSTPTLARLCSTPELHPHPRSRKAARRSSGSTAECYAKELTALQPQARRPDIAHAGLARRRFSPIWIGSASPQAPSSHPPVFTVERSRRDLRATLPGGAYQEPVLTRQGGPAGALSSPRTTRGSTEGAHQASRASAGSQLRLGRAARSRARRRARLGDAVRRSSTNRRPTSPWWSKAADGFAEVNCHPLENTGDHDGSRRTSSSTSSPLPATSRAIDAL